ETTAMIRFESNSCFGVGAGIGVGEGPVPFRALPADRLGKGNTPHTVDRGSGGRGRAQGRPLRRFRMAAVALAFIVAVVASTFHHPSADAPPLANFTINQYARIEATTDGLRLVYVLDMAEIPAFQEVQTIDTDGDGDVSSGESETYLAAKLPELAR